MPLVNAAPARRLVVGLTLAAGIGGVALTAAGHGVLASIAFAVATIGLALLFGVPKAR